jgi:hypothetical protein
MPISKLPPLLMKDMYQRFLHINYSNRLSLFACNILRPIAHIACMNSRQRRTLEAIFTDPVRANIAWAEIESLLLAVGCRVIEGAGSRVRFERRGIVATFHRPHPAKEAKRYQVRDAREYLEKLGIAP